MNKILRKLKEGDWSWKLFALVSLFAWSSWIDINGVFVELPILVANSPQGWALPSYLTVAIQLANIGPLIYLLLSKCVKYRGRRLATEVPAIFFIIITGLAASCILSFTWSMTTRINGKAYSSALISLTFLLSTVDCMSSVVFLPFMSYFPQQYITAYYVGAGFSAFLPSIVALIQGIGGPSYTCHQMPPKNITDRNTLLNSSLVMYKNRTKTFPIYHSSEPRFSVQAFFLFITAMLSVSLLAFMFLVRVKNNQKGSLPSGEEEDPSINNLLRDNGMKMALNGESQNECDSKQEESGCIIDSPQANSVKKIEHNLSRKSIMVLLIVNGMINGLCNGVIPALQSYACLPYGANIYHLTLVLSAAINPLACFFYFFISVESIKRMGVLLLVYLASAAYVITIASMSPCPLMNDSIAGGVLVLLISVTGVGIVSYLRTAISSVLQKQGHEALLRCGVSTQVGSLIFALTMFPMISIHGIFKNAIPCKQCG